MGRYFRERGVEHADDMSGIVLETFWRRLHERPLELEQYWRRPVELDESQP